LKCVYLALGSNLGDRAGHLQRAVRELNSEELRIERISPVYETAPQGFQNQRWFLNLVVEAKTSLLPMRLLSRCQKIEKLLGRRRLILNGPRTIDIDIVLFGSSIIHTDRLEIPHPRYRDRRFVLLPLSDLAPDLRDPLTRETVRKMAAKTAGQQMSKTALVLHI